MDHLQLTVDKLSVDAVSELVVDDSCGAVSVFVGTTRDNFEGKKVLRLEYEAYEPMALKAMKAICGEVRAKWPAVHGIAIYHRLGNVPCREASVIIAVSSPHRRESLDAVSLCIDLLKSKVPVWKREVYADADPAWKENVECPTSPPAPAEHADIDKNLIQINVSNEELQQRIQNFIERKREQVNISNIHDFIPGKEENETEDTCARVRTQFVKRSDSKGHLKIRKVTNEWGPQTVSAWARAALPAGVRERVRGAERFLRLAPVAPDVYRRLKLIEDRLRQLQAVSPEYADFWKTQKDTEETQKPTIDFIYSSEDIARKIEQLERTDAM